jgi:DNA-binding transcriptional regulator YiaG
MTPATVRAHRHALGMTQSQLGLMLRLSPDNGRTVRNWESGRYPISGPASLALEALVSGWRPD